MFLAKNRSLCDVAILLNIVRRNTGAESIEADTKYDYTQQTLLKRSEKQQGSDYVKASHGMTPNTQSDQNSRYKTGKQYQFLNIAYVN